MIPVNTVTNALWLEHGFRGPFTRLKLWYLVAVFNHEIFFIIKCFQHATLSESLSISLRKKVTHRVNEASNSDEANKLLAVSFPPLITHHTSPFAYTHAHPLLCFDPLLPALKQG